MKILPMTTDPAGSWPLRADVKPTPPTSPGEYVRLTAELQSAPMAFTGLSIGPDHRLSVLGPDGLVRAGVAGVWRIDAVLIDDVLISDIVGALAAEAAQPRDDQSNIAVHGDFGVGSRVAIHATNVGDTASYFYATWELEDVQ